MTVTNNATINAASVVATQESGKLSSRKEKALAASRKADEAGQRLTNKVGQGVGWLVGNVAHTSVVSKVSEYAQAFVDGAAVGYTNGVVAHEARVARKEAVEVLVTAVEGDNI